MISCDESTPVVGSLFPATAPVRGSSSVVGWVVDTASRIDVGTCPLEAAAAHSNWPYGTPSRVNDPSALVTVVNVLSSAVANMPSDPAQVQPSRVVVAAGTPLAWTR